jgi:hypothetical protein
MRAREEKSNSVKITKKKIFIEITEKMHKEGYTFTWEQVQGIIFICFSTIAIQFFTHFLDWKYAGR